MSENQETTEAVTITNHHDYAGFWMRFWAYLADLVIVFSINGILLSPFKFIDGGEMDVGFWTVTGIASTIVLYLYFVLMTKFYGKTLGKMIFGLRVIREDQEPLKWSDLLFREVIGRFIYRVFWFMNLFYLSVAFTEEKQGIHDMFADTRVVLDR
ncbi:RDD family protein [Lentibacillus cibarius]|uniref:RDD family protein n=1 Tax=Lentibacillus cibarius TaxID=2583219 RepID=A0A5S3QMG9_9BACI|nr:RDD family protein [Lentibacillus cibarius]TMN22979.1 RDD family protein [Lentibacillus cibarius]